MLIMPSASFASNSVKRYNGTVKTQWKTIAEAPNGFNQNVQVEHNSSMYKPPLGILGLDIRMLDKNGKVVWQESEAIPGSKVYRTFWCGPNVYKLQAKYKYGSGYVSSI